MSTITNNLNLTIPDDSDYINLKDFTDNFNILDALGIDYVTKYAYNTDTQWSWRQWKSGYFEAWATFSKTPSGDGEIAFTGNYPNNIKFQEPPTLTVTQNQELNGPAYIGFVRARIDNYDIRVINARNNGNPVYVRINVVGVASSNV